MRVPTCRHCRRRLEWRTTAEGKRVPCDPGPWWCRPGAGRVRWFGLTLDPWRGKPAGSWVRGERVEGEEAAALARLPDDVRDAVAVLTPHRCARK